MRRETCRSLLGSVADVTALAADDAPIFAFQLHNAWRFGNHFAVDSREAKRFSRARLTFRDFTVGVI
jgi:hypothetical protein